jgi:hypothetical protein
VQQNLGEIHHRDHQLDPSAPTGVQESIELRQRAMVALHPADGDAGVDHRNSHGFLASRTRSRRRRSRSSATRSRRRAFAHARARANEVKQSHSDGSDDAR